MNRSEIADIYWAAISSGKIPSQAEACPIEFFVTAGSARINLQRSGEGKPLSILLSLVMRSCCATGNLSADRPFSVCLTL